MAPGVLALKSSPRVELGFTGERFPQFLLRGGDFIRHDDLGVDEQVAAFAEPAATDTEFLAAGGAGGNLDVHRTIERGHGNLRAKHGLPRREFEFVTEVVAVHLEVRMLDKPHAEIQVTTAFATTGNAEPLAISDARRNLHLVRVGAVLTADGDGADGTAPGLLKRNHDVAFDVAALFGEILRRSVSTPAEACGATTHSRAKELLEEIAETGATKMRFKIVAAHRPAATKGLAAESAVAGRRTEFRAGLPIRAQIVIFFALVRVGENLVRLVDVLEFFLGLLFILRYVGMKFAGEPAEGFL